MRLHDRYSVKRGLTVRHQFRVLALKAAMVIIATVLGVAGFAPAAVASTVLPIRQASPPDDGGGALAPPPVDPHAIAWHIAGTNGRGARLRSGPSMSAATIGVLPEGTIIELVEMVSVGDGTGWQKVRLVSGLEGWVSEVLVHAPTGTASTPSHHVDPASGGSFVIGRTNGQGARLHTGTSISTQTLAVMPDGAPVQLLEGPVLVEGRFWRMVRAGDQAGWVVADYVLANP